MKMRYMAFLLIGALLCSLTGCKKAEVQKAQEESAGTGYGVISKTALTLQDLYFLRPGSKRSVVNENLGSSLSYAMEENTTDTYRLSSGEKLVLTYNINNQIIQAVYTDAAGKTQDFFTYLDELGIISNYKPGSSTVIVPEEPEETPEPEPEQPSVDTESGYFATKRYSYELAEQLLKLGTERETVVSAFGKPNSFSSVTFAKDSYLIDVYTMEDGSVLYLDYGYNREKLRAVRQVKGTAAVEYLGTWGQEEKPEGYIRFTRNQSVFNTLKKNAKPSEIYRRFGEPDWLEGSANRYRDAYMLKDGAIYYMDFGPNHTGLTAVVLLKADGTVVNYALK